MSGGGFMREGVLMHEILKQSVQERKKCLSTAELESELCRNHFRDCYRFCTVLNIDYLRNNSSNYLKINVQFK